jgi:hypothetical protein
VITPLGPAVSSRYGPSRGLGTIRDTEHAIDAGLAAAVERGIGEVLRLGGWT